MHGQLKLGDADILPQTYHGRSFQAEPPAKFKNMLERMGFAPARGPVRQLPTKKGRREYGFMEFQRTSRFYAGGIPEYDQ